MDIEMLPNLNFIEMDFGIGILDVQTGHCVPCASSSLYLAKSGQWGPPGYLPAYSRRPSLF